MLNSFYTKSKFRTVAMFVVKIPQVYIYVQSREKLVRFGYGTRFLSGTFYEAALSVIFYEFQYTLCTQFLLSLCLNSFYNPKEFGLPLPFS